MFTDIDKSTIDYGLHNNNPLTINVKPGQFVVTWYSKILYQVKSVYKAKKKGQTDKIMLISEYGNEVKISNNFEIFMML